MADADEHRVGNLMLAAAGSRLRHNARPERTVHGKAVSSSLHGSAGRRAEDSKKLGRGSENWLGDLDSNQDWPVQSRQFYR